MLTNVPLGVWEGIPALKITDDHTVISLIDYVASKRSPGIYALNFELSDNGWSVDSVGYDIVRLCSDSRFSHIIPWATREIGSKNWTYAPVHWVVDITPLLSIPRSITDVVDIISTLTDFPAPSEIVMRDGVDKSNIVPAMMNEIHTRLQVEGCGWIYSSDPSILAQARGASSRTQTRWGVRYDYHTKNTANS